jgi:hypothetical protein
MVYIFFQLCAIWNILFILLPFFKMAEKVNGIHPPAAEPKVNGHSLVDSEEARRSAYIR